jgi:MFS family permease
MEFNTLPTVCCTIIPMQQAAIDSSSLPAAAIIAVSFFVLGVSFAARSVIRLGMSPWSAEFGWSRGAISGAGSLGLCVMAIVVPLSGYAADRWGAGRLLVLGCAALAIALTALATMEQLLAARRRIRRLRWPRIRSCCFASGR